jgi:hypothetical protein
MTPRELEFELQGLYHAATYTLNRDGSLHVWELVRDNGDGDCEPCTATPEILQHLNRLLAEEIEQQHDAFAWETTKARRAGVRHLQALLND